MSVYRRKDDRFNERMARIRDEQLAEVARSLQDDALVVHADGTVTISAINYLTFPSRESAARFLKRVTTRRTK